MRIDAVDTQGFLGLGDAKVELPDALTVVVGPNGSGKSSLVRCIDLVMRAVGGVTDASSWDELERMFVPAVWEGRSEFECRLSLAMTTEREHDLLLAFLRAAALTSLKVPSSVSSAMAIDSAVRTAIGRGAAATLAKGTIVVHFSLAGRRVWTIGYEVDLRDRLCHLAMLGGLAHGLCDGPVVTR